MARLCIFCPQIFDFQTVKSNQQPAHATSGIPASIIIGCESNIQMSMFTNLKNNQF